MAVKVFLLGATGYIGGDALHALSAAHPDWELTCLARNPSRGALIAKQFPSARLVYGDLDSAELLADEAARSDVVLSLADCNHVAAARSLGEGLARREGGGFLVHVSGGGILTVEDAVANAPPGQRSEKVYDDWEGVGEVTSLPDEAMHRAGDKAVLAAAQTGRVKTAIVCPPTIVGAGRGPGNRKSDMVEHMARATLKRGRGFVVGEGENVWSGVNVHDVSELFLKLAEAAVAEGGGKATWGAEGYYFVQREEFTWGDVARQITKEAHKRGLIPSAELDTLGLEETSKLDGTFAKLWAYNSRSKAIRAGKLLGWSPKGDTVEQVIPAIVELEATDAGLKKSHAEKAAGDA